MLWESRSSVSKRVYNSFEVIKWRASVCECVYVCVCVNILEAKVFWNVCFQVDGHKAEISKCSIANIYKRRGSSKIKTKKVFKGTFPLIVVGRVCRLVGQMFDRIRWLVKSFSLFPPSSFFCCCLLPHLLTLSKSIEQPLRAIFPLLCVCVCVSMFHSRNVVKERQEKEIWPSVSILELFTNTRFRGELESSGNVSISSFSFIHSFTSCKAKRERERDGEREKRSSWNQKLFEIRCSCGSSIKER